VSQEPPIVAIRDLPVTAFVSIGNREDVLVQRQWAAFHAEVTEMLELAGGSFQGEWFCGPTAQWQTAAWCVDVQPGIVDRLKGELAAIGAKYGRGMVAWSEVASAVILG
jgi:hypothetical protein